MSCILCPVSRVSLVLSCPVLSCLPCPVFPVSNPPVPCIPPARQPTWTRVAAADHRPSWPVGAQRYNLPSPSPSPSSSVQGVGVGVGVGVHHSSVGPLVAGTDCIT
ncbi:predicted protein [Histoplasma capsulatum G186AR]|uniref:Secreted protein n=1 Tax=Ajellomyces capsulatus (strain G186AR / H82 / ATCC MYA-2454 / RMSCC 2432) TaxID=447093 RepID=C0NRK8_AJECG|nr:uncharacterized protein HCBG_05638 [Histoplasma capsulatum G186AR]EEH06322.1 predicted protein [Histoplasma capsulatum G186AR]